jgi:hypothetical protein
MEELFHIRSEGLVPISDDTLNRRLDALEEELRSNTDDTLRLRVLALEIPSAAPTDQTPDDGPAQSEGRAQAAA